MILTLYNYREVYLCYYKQETDFNNGFILMWNHNYGSMCEPGYFYDESLIKL